MPTASTRANADVVAVFTDIADLLEIEGANPFRVRAYRNAARTLGELGVALGSLIDQPEELDALPGIGADLAGKIVEVLHTGSCALLEELKQQLPAGITALLKIPGLGPRRVRQLHQALGIGTLAQLRQAAQDKRIQSLPGFGARSEQRMLEAANSLLLQALRHKRADMEPVARSLLKELEAQPGVHQVLAAGSLRRGSDTVGDLDLLVTCDQPRSLMDHFAALPDVQRVLQKGITRCSVQLQRGVQVDLRAVAPASFGAAALYFTGSKPHNIALRRLAQERSLKLNEYGLFRGSQRVAGVTEASIYSALGLALVPPELREDRGEISAAAEGRLPVLVQTRELQGDLHAHTQHSDGRDSLLAMAAAARARGLHYLAITDHCSRLAVLHGLDASLLARQIDRIDAFNAERKDIVLLKGVEVDILEDGTLGLANDLLRRLDLVVGAVHSGYGLGREQQTSRLLRAMDQPHFSILAHPTGRLINERPACEMDLQQVLRHARARGCFVELNADPARLDLSDLACRIAKAEGVLVSISADAHTRQQFARLQHGVVQARRGWLEAADVLNTRSLAQLRPLLQASMNR